MAEDLLMLYLFIGRTNNSSLIVAQRQKISIHSSFFRKTGSAGKIFFRFPNAQFYLRCIEMLNTQNVTDMLKLLA